MLSLLLACAPPSTVLPPGDLGQALVKGPKVLWEAQVGRMTWRSRMVQDGAVLLVPSNGDEWGTGPDTRDGLWVLDGRKGSTELHLLVPETTPARERDVNGVLVTEAGWTVSTDQNGLLQWSRQGALNWHVEMGGDIEFPPSVWRSPEGLRVVGAVERASQLVTVDPETGESATLRVPNGFEKAFSQVAVGDLNGDGVQDLVIAGRHSHQLIALDGQSQRALWQHEGHIYQASPQIVDVDGDGAPEVISAFDDTVVISEGATGKPKLVYKTPGARYATVHAFTWWPQAQCLLIPRSRVDPSVSCVSLEGELIWSLPILSQRISAAPTLADVDGDGTNEAIVATEGGRVLALNAQGELLWAWSAPEAIEAPVFAGDLRGDGRTTLVVASHDGWVRALKTPGLARGAQ